MAHAAAIFRSIMAQHDVPLKSRVVSLSGTFRELARNNRLPLALRFTNYSLSAQDFAQTETERRLNLLPGKLRGDIPRERFDERVDAFDRFNCDPDNLYKLAAAPDIAYLTPSQLKFMNNSCGARILIGNVKEARHLAEAGRSLLKDNTKVPGLAAFSGITIAGGAASRAVRYLIENPAILKTLGLNDVNTPRGLYPVGNEGRTLIGQRLFFDNLVAEELGVVDSHLVMVSHASAHATLKGLMPELNGWPAQRLSATFVFNQQTAHRIWLDDLSIDQQKLYPLGHADQIIVPAQYNIFGAMAAAGIKYLLLGNADEYAHGPDPVHIAVADNLFREGYECVLGMTPLTNKQRGGGPIKHLGSEELACREKPRLALEVLQGDQLPSFINTTFTYVSVPALARLSHKFSTNAPALTCKDGNRNGVVKQQAAPEDWTWDRITGPEGLRTMLMFVPRTQFNGIKHAGHLFGNSRLPEYGDRSHQEYHAELTGKLPHVIRGLLNTNPGIIGQLYDNGWSYVDVDV